MTSQDWKAVLQKANVSPGHQKEEISEDEFLSFEDLVSIKRNALQRILDRTLIEIDELIRVKRWEDALAISYPVDERAPDLVACGLDTELRAKAAFVLGQVNRFDEAIEELTICVKREPENFFFHNSLAYTAYNSLYAAANREVFLRGNHRAERIALAHSHFEKARELRPEGVTNFYRQAMLFKQIEGKPGKAIPLFEEAVRNWDRADEEQKKARIHERKNFIKALYQLAGALLETGHPGKALKMVKRCLSEDRKTEYLSLLYKYFALGKVLFHLNSFPEAKEALDFAAGREKDKPIDFVYELLARTCLAMEDPNEAMKYINTVPEKARRPYYRWTEADVLCALKDFTGARKVLLRSLERDNRSRHKALIRLAKIEYLSGNFQKSRKYATLADSFFRDKWGGFFDDGIFWQALNAYRLGERERAGRLAALLKDHNPHYPKLCLLLDRLSQKGAEKEDRAT